MRTLSVAAITSFPSGADAPVLYFTYPFRTTPTSLSTSNHRDPPELQEYEQERFEDQDPTWNPDYQVSALQALMKSWKNVPQTWIVSTDPCTSWDGISCSNGRVTAVKLPGMDLQGTLSNAIDQLSALTYLYFQNNKFTGPIPESLGLVRTLQSIRLDQNKFTGPVPNNIGNLYDLMELRLASNLLTGRVPDLSNATQLNYLDLSNNNFASSPAPGWFSTLTSLNTMSLVNNAFRGPLNMRSNISSVLRLVNLTNNQITEANIDPGYNVSLILTGNPICLHTTSSCTLKADQKTPSGTGLGLCGDVSCPSNQSTSPVASQNCGCTTSFQGILTIKAQEAKYPCRDAISASSGLLIGARENTAVGQDSRQHSSKLAVCRYGIDLEARPRRTQHSGDAADITSVLVPGRPPAMLQPDKSPRWRLAGLNLQGTLSNAIDQLSALTYLDLSNNPDLGGPLTPNIGNLKELTTLFSGNIPQEIGNLAKLTFLALNSNEFTGEIPPTLGLLSNLIWLDLSDNQLSGQIPISPGLNQLVNAQHLIFDNNKFNGPIPRSLGFVPNLTIIRLDQNQFSGPVPKSIGNLRNLMELSLASNLLNGTVPDLSNATQLNYLDLSNNDFTSSPAPPWFSELTSLNTLFMDNDHLTGSIPSAIFSLPELQQVSLAKNAFNTLDMRGNISSTLRVVNLTRNQIITADVEPSYSQSLILTDNPVCLDNNSFCRLQKHQEPYATSLDPCGAISCPFDQSANPVTSQNCVCTNPFQGLMIFRAPAFSDVTNPRTFQPLESTLAEYLSLERGSIALSNVQFGPGAPLTFTVKVFPVSGTSFNRSDVIRISSALVNQAYRAPRTFGPYSFIASAYFPSPSSRKSSMSNGAIIGIAIAAFILIAGLVLVAIYALRQKRIAKEAVERTTNPFASWGAGGKDNGDAPQLKGARYFSFDELKKCTSNFSQIYEIGSGGYGKVYKGTLTNGQIAAIKRAQQGSMQGVAEFKNEIELLSRVHHKNLVSLVGFCYEQGEQMLGYLDPEYYMTQQLSEKSDVYSFGVVMLELVTARQPIEKGRRLAGLNLQGTLSNAIDQLSALTYLDLSNNPDLGGPLTPNIGNLKELTTLFSGNIPQEIGNLAKLTFLALNSNEFTGEIPPTLGLLSNLIWLDLSDNQLSGQIPISPGLNQLVNAQHLIFDNNKFNGPIPRSLGFVPNLTIIRLDQNQFSGPVPKSIGNLRNLMELSLASNLLNGTVPDLSNATQLNYLDLSNNDFTSSPAPPWFSELTSLNTLFMDNDRLTGSIPSAIFSLPELQQVSLAKNAFNTLDMRGNISSTLRVVNLTRNQIITADVEPSYSQSLILTDNPVCLDNNSFCRLQKHQEPYATSLDPCGAISCPFDQSANPVTSQNCVCTKPFQGLMIFRAPAFSDVTNPRTFQPLESTLAEYLSLERGSIALSNVQFGPGAPLTFTVKVFPVSGTSFNRSDVIRISSALVNQAYRAPRTFGPYSFIASAYFPSPSSRKSSMSNGAIIGIAIAGFILIAGLVLVAIYALRQKRIAKEAVERTTNPFASWGAGGKDNGDAPQLKGARYFSFDELKKCTSNFSQIYEIGSGGYGKVYKGTLTNGQIAAIKRAQQGSMQGVAEFKNEIELLSRVHHKNLVSLVGFCYEQGEQMLGYLDPEYYMTQQLSEKSDVYSFGVVMLELVTARQPIEKGRRFVQLAMECVEESAVDRPTMNDVVKELEIIIQNEGAESLNTKTLSADQFGYAKARDPYEGHLPMKDESSSSTFDYNSLFTPEGSSLWLLERSSASQWFSVLLALRMKALYKPLLLFMILVDLPAGFCDTYSQDVAALHSLMRGWQNFPSSWTVSNDPCGAQWDGVMCNNGRITSLRLSSINLQGTLSNSIGQLSELVYLDLSSNSGLTGPLPTSIGNLKQLTTLFTGGIPQELGNLTQLSFLALNSNSFTGRIPASIGLLTNLFWLDLADNQLSGPIPISSTTSPGLDLLTHTKHLLFDNNQLSGPIPVELGGITTLRILRLDKNKFTEAVPANISNLVNLNGLNLADNQLRGTVPDLSTLTKLNSNSFWRTIWSGSQHTLYLASTAASVIFCILSNNALNGSLEMTGNISQQLQSVNLLNNRIVEAHITKNYSRTLVLVGNPVCLDTEFSSSPFCKLQQDNVIPYITNVTRCGSSSCSSDQSIDPANCGCTYPYIGKMFFRAPLFTDLSNNEHFQQLEISLWTELGLGSVFLSDVHFNDDDYLQIQVRLFPLTGTSFNLSELTRIGFDLSNQTYKPPEDFGPYFFVADPYVHIAASWGVAQKHSGGAPQLKGARFFSYDDLKNCTSNFRQENNEIGSGGYGKVYKGILADGMKVAIKRAQLGSKQGAEEFKNEIELLSRVHHRNLGYLDPEYYMTQQLSEKSDVYSFWCRYARNTKRQTAHCKGKKVRTAGHGVCGGVCLEAAHDEPGSEGNRGNAAKRGDELRRLVRNRIRASGDHGLAPI
ncbi:hypothetical protein PR202_ga09261 [Eleusine coracana subsp. coracana]|uniref:non-specific serine/threonine protein kinase n=1 Tax=Eleusine coracana subsp. coracana TaxID=191504 RepID=A0AAV5C4B0_ELECO|nr:hypothetical protein PR202_ga09261 [Eleusine coracana subsp. coracana]